MDKSTWKKGERKISRMFGTERTPLSGINSRQTFSDSLSKYLYIEIKHQKKIPADNLWQDTKRKAKIENKIPLIVFIKKNHKNPIILCNLRDIKKISMFIKNFN